MEMKWKSDSHHTVEYWVFSKLMSSGETPEIQKKWNDTMTSLNQKLQAIIRIPSIKLRFFRIGKQLELEKMLVNGSIQNTIRLPLLSPKHLRAWQIVDELISAIFLCFRGEFVLTQNESGLNDFFSVSTKENNLCLEIIRLSLVPELLVSLYMSPNQGDRVLAAGIIMHLMKLSRINFTTLWHNECACLVLEFCKMLRKVSHGNSLYLTCRSTLGLLFKNMDISSFLVYRGGASLMKEIFPFVSELENSLCTDLVSSTESPWSSGPFFGDVCDFKAFLLPLCYVVKRGSSADPILKRDYTEAFHFLYATFSKLLRKMDECLLKIEEYYLNLDRKWGESIVWRGWFQYLTILEELHKISKLYKVAEQELWTSLRLRQFSLSVLLVEHSKPTDDIKWLLEHKYENGCEFGRHWARQMIPKANEDLQRSRKMVIDRFHSMAASFTQIQGHELLPDNLLSPLGAEQDSAAELEDFDLKLSGTKSNISLHDSPENAVSYRYHSDRWRHVITNWEKGRLLGRGSFGSVYEGYAAGGFFFAVKEFQLLDQGNQAKQCIYQIEQEIALLSQFNHRNIVQYYGTDKNESKLYIFLELVSNGSLVEIYRRYHLKDSQVSAYTRQILQGLKYLHEHNIIHRDIKCANILVNVGGTIKLADFGLAKVTQFNNLIRSCKGTPSWMAPEVVNLKRNGGYGLPADIWSLGCTVLEMLTRKHPYSHLQPQQVLYRIGKGEPPPVPDFLSGLSQDFILKCLQVNPDNRPTAAQLLDHPFVKMSFHA